MTPQQRVEIALDLSEEVRQIAIDGIRSRDPAMSDDQVHEEWLRLLHGPQLARLLAALGRQPNSGVSEDLDAALRET